MLQPSGRYDEVGERIFGEKFYNSCGIDCRQHNAAVAAAAADDDEDDDIDDVSDEKDDVTGPRCHSAASFSCVAH